MMKSLGMKALAAATLITLGDAGAVHAHARTGGFSAGYTCRVPVLGARHATVSGTLTASPSPATAGTPTRFRLRVSGLSLRSPVPIGSWSITARIEVTGAQTTSFRMTGSGRSVPAHQPINADLTGVWTPRTRGTHRLRADDVTIRADVPRLGKVTVPCVPRDPRPVLATLVVTSPHRTGR
jgi:hypothetical protein